MRVVGGLELQVSYPGGWASQALRFNSEGQVVAEWQVE